MGIYIAYVYYLHNINLENAEKRGINNDVFL